MQNSNKVSLLTGQFRQVDFSSLEFLPSYNLKPMGSCINKTTVKMTHFYLKILGKGISTRESFQ